jgi:hypothetical protein
MLWHVLVKLWVLRTQENRVAASMLLRNSRMHKPSGPVTAVYRSVQYTLGRLAPEAKVQLDPAGIPWSLAHHVTFRL